MVLTLELLIYRLTAHIDTLSNSSETDAMDPRAIKEIIDKFTDAEQKIDKESLRQYVFKELTEIHKQHGYVSMHPEHATHWNALQDYIMSSGDLHQKQAVEDIRAFDVNLHTWIADHVDTPERMEFSIELKATEISTGDGEFDYYMALLIRHDQLLAAVHVYKEAIMHLEQAISRPLQEALTHPSFLYFCEKSLETRIFEMAEAIYRIRSGE